MDPPVTIKYCTNTTLVHLTVAHAHPCKKNLNVDSSLGRPKTKFRISKKFLRDFEIDIPNFR